MTGSRSRVDLKSARDSVLDMHKGLGVRRPDLSNWLGPDLRRIWGITVEDMAGVMAQTIVRLDQAISEIPVPITARIVRVSYNIDPDPALMHLKHQRRIELLASRLGAGYSSRTVGRRAEEARKDVAAQLDRVWAPISPDAVRAVLEREPNRREQLEQSRDGGAILCAIREVSNPRAQADRAIQLVLAGVVHVPRSSAGTLAIARTASHGDWVCAFTSASLLVEYQRSANPPWEGHPSTMTGADLLREMHHLELAAGVLVNPSADRNAEKADALPLPPELVANLVQSS
ncbi:hypothetical protein [Saccharopolyspora sp. NPDC002376]